MSRHPLPDRFRRDSISTARPTSPGPWRSASRYAEMRQLLHHLVLRGHIALATRAVCRRGTAGGPAGRRWPGKFLWKASLDYDPWDRGPTGGRAPHLGVATRGRRGSPGRSAVARSGPGLILSNEPGYYRRRRDSGIRIENLIVVQAVRTAGGSPRDAAILGIRDGDATARSTGGWIDTRADDAEG